MGCSLFVSFYLSLSLPFSACLTAFNVHFSFNHCPFPWDTALVDQPFLSPSFLAVLWRLSCSGKHCAYQHPRWWRVSTATLWRGSRARAARQKWRQQYATVFNRRSSIEIDTLGKISTKINFINSVHVFFFVFWLIDNCLCNVHSLLLIFYSFKNIQFWTLIKMYMSIH